MTDARYLDPEFVRGEIKRPIHGLSGDYVTVLMRRFVLALAARKSPQETWDEAKAKLDATHNEDAWDTVRETLAFEDSDDLDLYMAIARLLAAAWSEVEES